MCWAALDTVNLRDRIDTGTAALHAQIGEHGIRLSGGERQRFGAQHVPQRWALALVPEQGSVTGRVTAGRWAPSPIEFL